MARSGVLALGVVSWLVLLGAAGDARGQISEPVRVYTNADLERFGPPAPRVPPMVETEAGWRFVSEFIEREHSRIDAERENELRRRESDRMDRLVERTIPSAREGWLPGLWPGVRCETFTAPPAEQLWPAGRVPYVGGASWHREFLNRRETIHGRPPLSAPAAPPGKRNGPGRRR